jgi:hypothetical protein
MRQNVTDKMSRTKCHKDKMSSDKMSWTKCHGQNVVDKMSWTECHGQAVVHGHTGFEVYRVHHHLAHKRHGRESK